MFRNSGPLLLPQQPSLPTVNNSKWVGVGKVMASEVDPVSSVEETNHKIIKEEDSSDKEDDENDKPVNKKKEKNPGGKSRRELPAGAVATLKQWLLSPEHFTHPYPTPQDQVMLMEKTGIDKKQLKNWFTNARRRIWKPMLKKQLEQGTLKPTNAGGGGVAMSGIVPGLIPTSTNDDGQKQPAASSGHILNSAHALHAMQAHFNQAMQQHQSGSGTENRANSNVYQMNNNESNNNAAAQNMFIQAAANNSLNPSASVSQLSTSYSIGSLPQINLAQNHSIGSLPQINLAQNHSIGSLPQINLAQNHSIGSLPQINLAQNQQSINDPNSSANRLNKIDSHAVLMELFARDQDLVLQAQASDNLKKKQMLDPSLVEVNQHPMMRMAQAAAAAAAGNHNNVFPNNNLLANRMGGGGVPSLNSWPHFSSVASLNNLGTLAGVKTIASLSGADLSQASLGKKGNLGQVKSEDSMGRADSYAFLEVFFDNQNNNNPNSIWANNINRNASLSGIKREREEDNDVGLSLDADESPSNATSKAQNDSSYTASSSTPVASAGPKPAPLPPDGNDRPGVASYPSGNFDNNTLKRAYDDALAARGLLSVSRSSEKLTEMELPPKMQRTLSQELFRQQVQNQYGSFGFAGFQMQQGQMQQPQSILSSSAPLQLQAAAGAGQYLSNQQYPGQKVLSNQTLIEKDLPANVTSTPLSDPSMTSASVEVPASTTCALCNQVNVDTQLRPCGHMFHGRCLKPSLQNALGPPVCPIDNVPMQSAFLAIPTACEDIQSNTSSTKSSQEQQQQLTGGNITCETTKSSGV